MPDPRHVLWRLTSVGAECKCVTSSRERFPYHGNDAS